MHLNIKHKDKNLCTILELEQSNETGDEFILFLVIINPSLPSGQTKIKGNKVEHCRNRITIKTIHKATHSDCCIPDRTKIVILDKKKTN